MQVRLRAPVCSEPVMAGLCVAVRLSDCHAWPGAPCSFHASAPHTLPRPRAPPPLPAAVDILGCAWDDFRWYPEAWAELQACAGRITCPFFINPDWWYWDAEWCGHCPECNRSLRINIRCEGRAAPLACWLPLLSSMAGQGKALRTSGVL